LRPEGEFEKRTPDKFIPAERPKQKRPEDNLHPEGSFPQKEKEPFIPAERPKQKIPQDNLRPEGMSTFSVI